MKNVIKGLPKITKWYDRDDDKLSNQEKKKRRQMDYSEWDPEDHESYEDEKPNIMIIEADSFIQRRLRAILKDLCAVSYEFSIENALELLEDDNYALVITSLDWPDYHNEKAILEAIRGLTGYEEVPVIAIGSENDPDSASDYLMLGYDAYFALPFDPWLVRKAVGNILDLELW